MNISRTVPSSLHDHHGGRRLGSTNKNKKSSQHQQNNGLPTSVRPVLRKAQHTLKRDLQTLNASWNKNVGRTTTTGSMPTSDADIAIRLPSAPSSSRRRGEHHDPGHHQHQHHHSSRIASTLLKKLLWGDIRSKSLSKRLKGGMIKKQMKIDGLNKDVVEKKDPRTIDSNFLEKTQGKQRGLVLQIDESMLLLGQLQDTVNHAKDYSKQFDAVLNQASALWCSQSASLTTTTNGDEENKSTRLTGMLESNVAEKAIPEGTPPLRRKHTRNNSLSAPSLLGGDLFNLAGNHHGSAGNDECAHGGGAIHDSNDLLAGMMGPDIFEYCALNHIVS